MVSFLLRHDIPQILLSGALERSLCLNVLVLFLSLFKNEFLSMLNELTFFLKKLGKLPIPNVVS
jgi:hypothetical protein